MKNTRSHAPIAEVLAAAGVANHHSRTVTPHDEEDRWMRRRQMSVARMDDKRDRRRDCAEPGWCGIDGSFEDDGQDSTSAGHSWETRGRSRDADEEADTEEETRVTLRRREAKIRARARELRKGPRSYRVANPDRTNTAPQNFSEKYEMWQPGGRQTKSASRNSLEHDEAYMLTQEVLAYSFGGNT